MLMDNAVLRLLYSQISWKKAECILVLKLEKLSDLSVLYRPISLLQIILQLFQLFLAQLKLNFEDHRLVSNEQCGFREHHSIYSKFIE